MIFSVLVCCEFAFAAILGVIHPNVSLTLSDMPWQIFYIKLVSLFILKVIQKKTDKGNKTFYGKMQWMYLIIPIMSIAIMATTFSFSIEAMADINIKIATTFCAVTLLYGNIILFVAFNQYSKNLYRSIQDEWLLAKEEMNARYYEKISDLNDKRIGLIHNFFVDSCKKIFLGTFSLLFFVSIAYYLFFYKTIMLLISSICSVCTIGVILDSIRCNYKSKK